MCLLPGTPIRASQRPAHTHTSLSSDLTVKDRMQCVPSCQHVCTCALLCSTPSKCEACKGTVQVGDAAAPEGWWVTPRKVEVPREKPWLCRRTAMMSSSSEMPCMHSSGRHTCATDSALPQSLISSWPAQDAMQVNSRTVECVTLTQQVRRWLCQTSRAEDDHQHTWRWESVLTLGPLHFSAATSYASAA